MLVNDFKKMLSVRLKMLSAFNKSYKRTPNIKKKELRKAFKNISKKELRKAFKNISKK
jgi:hypothetical protein